MEDVIFCDEIVEKVTSKISVTESQLNKKIQHKERQTICKTLKSLDESNLKFLQQRKNNNKNILLSSN